MEFCMADMSEMLKNFASMMEGKEIPDNIKEMLNSLQNSSSGKSNNSTDNNANNNNNSNNNGISPNDNTNQDNRNTHSFDTHSSNSQNNSQSIPNIDINTMMKMQKIISAMNNSSNNSGVNLLRSLKPYLKPSRQAKVDEYIQLFNIEKVIELMKQSGGDNKNDT